MEMVDPEEDYEIIALAQGTTTTSLGVLFNSNPATEIWCFPVLKGFDSRKEMESLAVLTGYGEHWETQKHRVKVFPDYSFSGYAKKNEVLVGFISEIQQKYGLPLDNAYTGKSFYGLLNELTLLQRKKVLFIHTGGVLPL
jgi:1-aminocyclopropane-1-carboxylate deaminase/D-cysteine desulfhydrase-like pyridoxal-dependent ACC family enzyme